MKTTALSVKQTNKQKNTGKIKKDWGHSNVLDRRKWNNSSQPRDSSFNHHHWKEWLRNKQDAHQSNSAWESPNSRTERRTFPRIPLLSNNLSVSPKSQSWLSIPHDDGPNIIASKFFQHISQSRLDYYSC